MAVNWKLAVVFLGIASALKLALQDGSTDVGDVKAKMQSASMDLNAQKKGCEELNGISQQDRGDPGPYGGQRVATKWLVAGLYEAVAQGLLNIIEMPNNPDGSNQESEDALFDAATTCFGVFTSAIVQNDHEKSLAMYRNTPHLWDAFVGYFRKFRNRVLNDNSKLVMFAGLFGNWGAPRADEPDDLGEISKGLDQAGGFKFILEVLDQNYTNPVLFQAATAALSDHLVGTRAAPKIIADNDGIRILTNAVRHAHASPHYHEENGFGLRYEVLEDITGLLKNDDHQIFTNAFVEEGLLHEVIKFMPEETDDLYFQDHCCQVFNWLSNSHASVRHELAQPAVAQLVKKAATVPCAPKCVWPPPVKTWGVVDEADLPPSCIFTQRNLEAGEENWKEWSNYERQP